jgi:hypothetical protein
MANARPAETSADEMTRRTVGAALRGRRGMPISLRRLAPRRCVRLTRRGWPAPGDRRRSPEERGPRGGCSRLAVVAEAVGTNERHRGSRDRLRKHD